MRDAGTVLKVLDRLADTPGGGSNTKIRPALNRLEGSYNVIKHSQRALSFKTKESTLHLISFAIT